MENLSKEDEAVLIQFSGWLTKVTGPDDILPPDGSGCRESVPQPLPKLPSLQVELGNLALCSV